MSSSSSKSNTTTPKHFINDPESTVSDYIQGLLLQYPTRLVKLAQYSVVLGSHTLLFNRNHHPTSSSLSRVHLLSGGGSGHEPSHAGYIATNMLSGAVLGGIFASPSVSSILAAIRTLCILPQVHVDDSTTTTTTTASCLLIVKNYTGDRLNFGMACELAQAQGIDCQMVLVADDVSSSQSHVGARGIAGTVLVHKVAGAAAYRHTMTLQQVASLAQMIASQVKTIGVALDAVTLPGATTINTRLQGHVIEIGLGIHGEAGWYQCPPMPIRHLIPILIAKIYNYGYDEVVHEEKDSNSLEEKTSTKRRTFDKGDDLLVLINNLGGTSNFEMSIVARDTVEYLESETMGYCQVSRLYVGSFMTSFNMHGISLSILSLSRLPSLALELLDEPTDAPGWMNVDVWKRNCNIRPSMTERFEPPPSIKQEIDPSLSLPLSQSYMNTATSSLISRSIKAACQTLIDAEPLLTKYDTIVGDGDCGFTMERGAKEILSRLNTGTIPLYPPSVLFASLADGISASMGGTSGILLELMFRKMSSFMRKFQTDSSWKEDIWVEALKQGVDAMSFYGGAIQGSRTMLDALYPAVESLEVSPYCFKTCANAAKDGADATANMARASAGRSNYLREETLVGTPDPGAIAISLVFHALSQVME